MAWHRPKLSVLVSRAVPPLDASMILTAAPGMTPPDASTTIPLMFYDCAIIGCVTSASRIAERIAIFTLSHLLLGFILTSSLHLYESARSGCRDEGPLSLVLPPGGDRAVPKSHGLLGVNGNANQLEKQALLRAITIANTSW